MLGDNLVFDKEKQFRGDSIKINDYITVHQPTLREIVDFGAGEFMKTVHTLCSIPSDMKSFLYDDLHIDYSKISDFEYFGLISRPLTSNDTKLLFGEELDFSKMKYATVKSENKSYIGIPIIENDELIDFIKVMDEETYDILMKHLRGMFNITPKVEKYANSFTMKVLLKKSRQKREQSKFKKDDGAIFMPLIITLVNTEEFKYGYNEVYDLTITQFMASAEQVPHKKYAESLINASMSGFVDMSKMKNRKEAMNWMYIDKSEKVSNEPKEQSKEEKDDRSKALQEEMDNLRKKIKEKTNKFK